jgi:Fe2+ or Zn2+ uptake regulation protein
LGLFLPADAEPIPPAESHDQVFCMNCGEADECREPPFADVLRLMKGRRLRPSQ